MYSWVCITFLFQAIITVHRFETHLWISLYHFVMALSSITLIYILPPFSVISISLYSVHLKTFPSLYSCTVYIPFSTIFLIQWRQICSVGSSCPCSSLWNWPLAYNYIQVSYTHIHFFQPLFITFPVSFAFIKLLENNYTWYIQLNFHLLLTYLTGIRPTWQFL